MELNFLQRKEVQVPKRKHLSNKVCRQKGQAATSSQHKQIWRVCRRRGEESGFSHCEHLAHLNTKVVNECMSEWIWNGYENDFR